MRPGRKVEDLVVKGPSLSLKGDVFLNADGGLKSAKFSQVWLSDENNFILTMEPAGEGQAIDISGKSFDARPFMKSMFRQGAPDSHQQVRSTPEPDRQCGL